MMGTREAARLGILVEGQLVVRPRNQRRDQWEARWESEEEAHPAEVHPSSQPGEEAHQAEVRPSRRHWLSPPALRAVHHSDIT